MATLLDALLAELGNDKVSGDILDRFPYSRDWSPMPHDKDYLPDIVCTPRTVKDIESILRIAMKFDAPVVPWGGGTGMGGDNLAVHGGIVVATRQMNKVLEIDAPNHTIAVEAGATIQQVNDALAPHGLWFPHDPESKPTSTVGAAIACDNDGTFGIKYGGMVDYLTEAVVTVPGGETYRLGQRKASCTSSGYKLLWSLIGSEGTLGIISSARLRVFPRPARREVGLWVAPSLKAAMDGIIALHKAGVWLESAHINDKYRLDYYTHAYHQKTGKAAEIPPGYDALLALTVSGDADVVAFSHKKALGLLDSMGIVPFDNTEITEYWWASKHTLSWEKNKWSSSQKQEKFGAADVAVPLARIPEMYDTFIETASRHGLPIVGTAVYHGRPHYSPSISFAVYVDDHDKEKVAAFYRYVHEMSVRALELEGTMSSYIGDGTRLRELTPLEHGPGLSLMWQLKRIFDPTGIMNPGKIFPREMPKLDTSMLREGEL